MKKQFASALALVMALCLALCGSSLTALAASSASGTEQWDTETERTYEYEEGEIVLMETELVCVSAGKLSYKSSNDGMALRFYANVENLSDGDIRVVSYPEGSYDSACNAVVHAGETVSKAITAAVQDWDGLVGGTEECCQGTYLLKVISDSDITETVQFDWYASEKAPFVNVSSVESKDYGSDLDRYRFRQSSEVVEFMQKYAPDVEPEWGEPVWIVNGEFLTLKGQLTPDKESLVDLSATIRSNARNKMDEEEMTQTLLSFLEEFSDTTGLDFEGAAEFLSEKMFDEEEPYAEFCSEDGVSECMLSVYCRGKNTELYFAKMHRAYGVIPYTLEDALAYMQDVGGEEASCTRKVQFGEKRSYYLDPPYYASVTLDENERVVSVDAGYELSFVADDEREKANGEARTFFEDIVSFFLSGEVKEEALEYIDAQYGSDGEGDTSYRIGWDYQVGLSLPKNNSTFSIDVSRDSVPEDAQVFPDEEEQEALLLDPIARLGIDQDVEVPETVLLEQDDMRVVLEGAVYTNDDIVLVIRGENIPDEIHMSVMLNELNGSGLLNWEDTQRTLETTYFDNDEPHDPVMTERIYIGYRDILNYIPGFTGISTLKFNVRCEKDPAAVNAAAEVTASSSTVVETGY